MLIPRSALGMLSAGMMGLAAGMVSGQSYPNKTIRILAAGAGGNTDFAARLIAQGISGPLGQPVVVDNRGTNIASESVSKAPPDGYTLLVAGTSLWTQPFLQKTAYDPVKDFSPISLVATAPNVLVVHPSLPVKSVKDLIALAKARPAELNYATSATGSANHLAGELFKAMAGINIVRINYKGVGPAINDLIGGRVQLMLVSPSSVMSNVKARRLKALAVTSTQPSALAPGLPTVAASGLPGYESVTPIGVFAPAQTAEVIINRLNNEIGRFLSRADMKERLVSIGLEASPSSPEQFATAMKSDMERMGKLIKDAGIRAE